MAPSILLSVLVALLIIGYAVLQRRGRRAGSWQLLRDLSPVSSQWLADYRRSR
jgi:hypothetical protein